jgi:hypothetical protein
MSDAAETRPQLPAPFARGQRLLASNLEAVRQSVAFALRDMIGSGPGILISRRGDRYLISAQRQSASSATPPAPFTLYDASTSAGSPPTTTLKVGITPGLVNGISPSTSGGLLSAIPPPLETITSTTHFWVRVVATFGTPDSYVVTIATDTAADAYGDDDEVITSTGFTSYWYLGYAWVSSGAISEIVSEVKTNLGCETGGTFNLWWAAP